MAHHTGSARATADLHHAQLTLLAKPTMLPTAAMLSCVDLTNMCLQVSNAAGYLCHIQLNCRLEVPPEVVFEIFSHPDNAGAFRDIKKVGYRKVSQAQPSVLLFLGAQPGRGGIFCR
jgi:pyrrolidone-carboxylate peptidase